MSPLRIPTMPRRALVQLEAPTRDGGPNVTNTEWFWLILCVVIASLIVFILWWDS